MKFRLLILFLAMVFTLQCRANLQEIVTETQKVDLNGNHMKMIWWIPSEYWVEAFKSNPDMTEESIKSFISVVDKYTIVAVVDATIGPFGGITAKEYDEIEKELTLETHNSRYLPINKAELSPDIVNFFQMMKPILGGMLGQFGDGTEFFAFEGKDKNGNRLIDPMKEQRFTLTLENSYKYRLPLGSLLPKKMDPTTREEFPGNYKFNPFTGARLR